MITPECELILESLRQAPWFTRVGQPVEIHVDFTIQNVASWNDAIVAAAHPGSSWCSLEAKLIVYRELANSHYSEFSDWNAVAKEHLPHAVSIIRKQVMPAIRVRDGRKTVTAFVQSIIVGALAEQYYERFVSCRLNRRLIPLLCAGHFPCGWALNSAEEFPDRAAMCVF